MGKSIAIIGCGLTGSQFPYPLASVMRASEWSADIVYIDYDVIELRNSPASLPMVNPGVDLKAEFVAKRSSEHGLVAIPVMKKVTSENAKEILDGHSLIIGAVDNDETRTILWLYAKGNEVPYMDVGVNEFSGRVSWMGGGYDSHPFAPQLVQTMKKKSNGEKLPPCTLFGTRKIAAIVVELAVQSLSTFWRGHDPHDVVLDLAEEKAKRGDMVGWNIQASSNTITCSANYVGGFTW